MIPFCESSPCLNGATCTNIPNSFSCNCNGTGFTGLYCEFVMSTPSPSSSSQNDQSSNSGAIAGGVIGGILGLALIVGVVYFIMKKKPFRSVQNFGDLREEAHEMTV